MIYISLYFYLLLYIFLQFADAGERIAIFLNLQKIIYRMKYSII